MRSHLPASPSQHNPYNYSRPTSRQKKDSCTLSHYYPHIPSSSTMKEHTRPHRNSHDHDRDGVRGLYSSAAHPPPPDMHDHRNPRHNSTLCSSAPPPLSLSICRELLVRVDRSTDLAAGSPDNRRRLIALIFGVARRHKSTI